MPGQHSPCQLCWVKEVRQKPNVWLHHKLSRKWVFQRQHGHTAIEATDSSIQASPDRTKQKQTTPLKPADRCLNGREHTAWTRIPAGKQLHSQNLTYLKMNLSVLVAKQSKQGEDCLKVLQKLPPIFLAKAQIKRISELGCLLSCCDHARDHARLSAEIPLYETSVGSSFMIQELISHPFHSSSNSQGSSRVRWDFAHTMNVHEHTWQGNFQLINRYLSVTTTTTKIISTQIVREEKFHAENALAL